MSYSATVTNSVIDTTNIKNILVQGESTHPEIVFSLDAALTGLTWYVRSTYLSFNLTTESSAITPVETESAVTVTWTVDGSFTTLYGAAQLVLVGLAGETTNVRAVGYINVARDWSSENQGAITLNLFEQLLAQAAASIGHYAYIDETTGNWFNWNPSLGAFEDTGVHAQGIQGIQGETGATGAGIASGGTTGQALVKASGDDFDTEWAGVVLLDANGKAIPSKISARIQTKTESFSLTEGDNGTRILCNSASAMTITVAPDLSVGYECELVQYGAGQLTVAAGSGVTLKSTDNKYLSAKQNAIVCVAIVESNVALIGGERA